MGSSGTAYCDDPAFDKRPAYSLLVAVPARVIRRLVPELPAPPGPLFGYLRDLERTTSYIDLQGISSGAGESRAATRSPIESLYTPLRARGPFGDMHTMNRMEARETRLADLVSLHPRLLFSGEPGSGKTTFLRFVACMLARDALGMPGPGGRPWRAVHLGLPAEGKPPIPIFVRLTSLAERLERCAERDVQPDELLHAAAPDTDRAKRDAERKAMERALVDGDAVLLLDGLDEVTHERARERTLRVIEGARKRWLSARIVATSRPFETKRMTERGLDFQEMHVEPFDRAEIHEFLDRWVRALPGVDSGYRKLLEHAIVHREEIRRLAENPVMLTCLCVVHWNERQLPSGRAAAYRAVIKWLLLARKDQRVAAGFPQGFAERALPELALRMMISPGGKQVSIGFADAAAAVERVAVAYKKKLRDGEDPRFAAEKWLRWECGAREVPWRDRLAAAEALGRAGDFRLEGSPIDRMIEVRPGLSLGKYPVTVQEYGDFVEAGGYREKRFWDEEGWQWRTEQKWEEPRHWQEQKGFRNRPVVGVSWFEAKAYCAWLAHKTREPIRLPAEAEWEEAATHPAGDYPWGREDPTPEHANYGWLVGAPTPVGLYPQGAAPCGHLDMAGNVWEWCVDKLSTRERAPLRALRGGGCWNDANKLRSACSGAFDAEDRFPSVGFRLALSRAPVDR